jgi:quinone-modifying oxidoreductase subunit QmoB
LGSVASTWVVEAMSAGYDGVIMIGCKYGDDYQCHFITGSELAQQRGDNIREKLEKASMENERVELHQLQISDYANIPEIFNKFAELIDEIGMNPFKGM